MVYRVNNGTICNTMASVAFADTTTEDYAKGGDDEIFTKMHCVLVTNS